MAGTRVDDHDFRRSLLFSFDATFRSDLALSQIPLRRWVLFIVSPPISAGLDSWTEIISGHTLIAFRAAVVLTFPKILPYPALSTQSQHSPRSALIVEAQATFSMDPVTVVSVVGLTIEFVEFAKTVVQKSHEIYKSVDNSLVENNVIEEAARRASQFTKDLEASHEKGLGGRKGKESPHYQTLQSTVMACAREAKLLADLLEKLKPKSKGKWVSMHQAVCSELKKKDIRKLEKSLGKHQKEVMLCLLGIIKYHTTNCACINEYFY